MTRQANWHGPGSRYSTVSIVCTKPSAPNRGMTMRSSGMPRLAQFAVVALGLMLGGMAWGQYCAGGSTFFSPNLVSGCTVGSCWAQAPFPGSSTISGSQYPAANYACASATPLSGALEVTLQTYDGNGNRTSSQDPLAHTTGNSYDALNRLTQVQDPAAGATAYGYDQANNLTQVTVPLGHATTYTYSGLDDLITQVSPDTGRTTDTYDATGNLLSRTDARGATATYTYDNLNRVTQAVFSRTGFPNETHTFTYDTGTFGNGHLTQLADSAGTTSWIYTQQGRVASRMQQVGTLTKTVSMGYNSAGQLTSMTTPSGQVIGYAYLNNRVAGMTINGNTLLSNVTADPFGPPSAWQWSNGLKSYRDYDQDG